MPQVDAETVGTIAGGSAIVWILIKIFGRLLGSFDTGQERAIQIAHESKAWAEQQVAAANARAEEAKSRVDEARDEFNRRIGEEREFHERRFTTLDGDYQRVAADGDRCREQLYEIVRRISKLESHHLGLPAVEEGE